jgi:hypothetical protein
VTDLLCQIAACTWLIQSPKRVTDREPNDAAGRDSGEEHPIYRFKGKHGRTLLLILRMCYMQRACLGAMPVCGRYGGIALYVGYTPPAAFFCVASPVIAMVLSTLFEGYQWTWAAAGVVLAVIGNGLALAPSRPHASAR